MTMDSAGPVIAGVDGSPAGYQAATWAAREAWMRGRRLLLLAVNTWPSYLAMPFGGRAWDAETGRTVCQDILHQARQEARGKFGGLTIRSEVTEGLPARILVERGADAALIVVGRRGGGEFSRLVLGSSAAQVAAYARCPVAVVPESAAVPAGDGAGVVVGVDIGDQSQERSGSLSMRRLGGTCH